MSRIADACERAALRAYTVTIGPKGSPRYSFACMSAPHWRRRPPRTRRRLHCPARPAHR